MTILGPSELGTVFEYQHARAKTMKQSPIIMKKNKTLFSATLKDILSATFLGLSLSACSASNFQTISESHPAVISIDEQVLNQTGAKNSNDIPYTSFSPLQQYEDMVKDLVTTDETLNLASPISWLESRYIPKDLVGSQLSSDSVGRLELRMKHDSQTNYLLFTGELKKDAAGTMRAQMQETTPTKSKLSFQIEGACQDSSCTFVSYHLIAPKKSLKEIRFLTRQEVRTLKLLVSPEQKKDYVSRLNPSQQSNFESLSQGADVLVKSFEVYPGRSGYRIEWLHPATSGKASSADSIQGELLDIKNAGPQYVVQNKGAFADLGKLKNIGNSGDGELMFHVEPTPKASAPTSSINPYLYLVPRKVQAGGPVRNFVKSPDLVPGSKSFASDLLRSILNESQVSDVQAFFKKNNPQRVNSVFTDAMKTYLACYHKDMSKCTDLKTQKARDQVLSQIIANVQLNQYPGAWSVISVFESGFNTRARGSAGELGVWQMKADVGRIYGAPGNSRMDIVMETKASLAYFTELISQWRGDYKFAVASYNMGNGNMQNACIRGRMANGKCSIQGSSKKGIEKFNDVQDMFNAFKEDGSFWKLYHMRALGAGGDYAMRFIAGVIAIQDPKTYGFDYAPVDIKDLK